MSARVIVLISKICAEKDNEFPSCAYFRLINTGTKAMMIIFHNTITARRGDALA